MGPRGVRERQVFVLTLLVAVVLCLGVWGCLPAGEAADEGGHLAYVETIWRKITGAPGGPVESTQTVQQPPAYYVYVAAFRAMLPAELTRPVEGASIELPYERRVVIDRGAVFKRMPPLFQPWSDLSGFAPYVWRLSGILPLLILVFLIFRTAWAVFPEAPATATLAAATGVLVPQLPATFGAITNDQFALLFGSAGFATAVAGALRGKLGPVRVLAAGALIAVALLSKVTAAGPAAATAILVAFFEPRPLLVRIRDLALFGAPSLLAVGWWFAVRLLETGYIDPVFVMGVREPFFLRAVAPDWFGVLETFAMTTKMWMGWVGYDTNPGEFLALFGAALPATVVGGSLFVAFSGKASRKDRVLAASFLGGLAVMVAFMVNGMRYAFVIHGRYLQPLVLPGTLSLVVASRALFARHRDRVLAAFVTWFGVMGIVLLHGAILPSFHPPRDRFESPDFAAYVAPGASWAANQLEHGVVQTERYRSPGTRKEAMDPKEVRVRLPKVDPAGAYVAWLRIWAPSSPSSLQDYLADDLPLGGIFDPRAVTGWLPFAIPRAASVDGSVTISARAQSQYAVLSEILVTRIPLEVRMLPTMEGDRVRVELASNAPERLPALLARARFRDGPSGDAVAVSFEAGRARLELPLPRGATGAVDLALAPPAWVWSDCKVAPFTVAPGERDVHKESPGFEVVRIREGLEPGTVVLRLPEVKLVRGHFEVELLDEKGSVFPRGVLALVGPAGNRTDIHDSAFDVDDPARPQMRVDVSVMDRRAHFVDRIRLRHSEPWIFDLGLSR